MKNFSSNFYSGEVKPEKDIRWLTISERILCSTPRTLQPKFLSQLISATTTTMTTTTTTMTTTATRKTKTFVISNKLFCCKKGKTFTTGFFIRQEKICSNLTFLCVCEKKTRLLFLHHKNLFRKLRRNWTRKNYHARFSSLSAWLIVAQVWLVEDTLGPSNWSKQARH